MLEQALADLDVESFWKDGFVVIHDMYTPEEVEQIRQEAYASKGSGGDLLANPLLSHVLTDGRMTAVARKLLGTDELFYCGDSSFTINGTQKGWHKDNTDRLDPKAPDWDSRYTQLRFGIYCQDHVTHTGGLNLKIGSHDIANLKDGETLYVQTRPGDLAVWSMRITHSGNGMLLKDSDAPFPEPSEHDRFSADEVAPADGDRIAVFAHLGANDSHGTRYADYLKTRTYMVNAWRKRPYDDTARAAAAESGLTLRDMPAEVMDDPGAGLNEQWKPFAYPGWTPPRSAAPPTTPAARPVPPAPGAGTAAASGGAAQVSAVAVKLGRVAARRGKGVLKGAIAGWRSSAPKQ